MTSRFGVLATILLTAAALLAACGGGVAATTTPVATPTATVAPSPTPTTAATPTVALAATETPSPGAPAGAATGDVVFRLVPEQSEARYRAREQLLGRSLPNDAVGRTNAVEGQIVFTADGAIDAARSKFTVDLTTLRSDESRRDNYIKQNTLEVDRYPNAEFQPTAESGLPWPLPQSGQLQFQLEGNLTVHGVTKPVTWDVQATIDGGRITGTATTQVTFQDFGMTPPRVPIVLSLEDTITLELDFTFEPVS